MMKRNNQIEEAIKDIRGVSSPIELLYKSFRQAMAGNYVAAAVLSTVGVAGSALGVLESELEPTDDIGPVLGSISYENSDGRWVDGLQVQPCSEQNCEYCTVERPAFFRAPISRAYGLVR